MIPLDHQIATLTQQLTLQQQNLEESQRTQQQREQRRRQLSDERQTLLSQQQQEQQWRRDHAGVADWGERLGGWRERFQQQQQLRQNLTAMQEKQRQHQQQLNEQQQLSDRLASASTPLESELERARQHAAQAEQALTALEEQQPESALRRQLEQQQRQRPLRQKLAICFSTLRPLSQRHTQQQQELLALDELIVQQTQQLEQRRRAWKEKHQHRIDLQKRTELEQRIVSLEQERARLIAGEPCPLCGATEHPAVAHYQTLTLNENQQRLENVRQQEEQLRIEGVTCGEQLKALQSQQQRLMQQQQTLSAELTRQQDEWHTLLAAAELTLAPEDEAGLSARIEQQERQESELQAQLQQREGAARLYQQAKEALAACQQRWQQQHQARQLAEQQLGYLRQQRQEAEQQQRQLSEQLALLDEALTQELTQHQLTLPEPQAQQARLRIVRRRGGAGRKANSYWPISPRALPPATPRCAASMTN